MKKLNTKIIYNLNYDMEDDEYGDAENWGFGWGFNREIDDTDEYGE